MKTYVAGFALDDEEAHVLLIRKDHPRWQAGMLNGLGGKVETGELPGGAMVREFQEESGIKSWSPTWEPFCRLSGCRLSGDDLSGEAFEVWFFRAHLTLNHMVASEEITRDRPERTQVIPTADLLSRGAVANLHWLVEMASNRHRKDWPYDVFESSTSLVSIACGAMK